MTAIENEATKDFISIKVLFVQRHQMKLWIAHGECRPLFILTCTVLNKKLLACVKIVVRLQKNKIKYIKPDTAAFHRRSCTVATHDLHVLYMHRCLT
jgi:hypothetical protein